MLLQDSNARCKITTKKMQKTQTSVTSTMNAEQER